MFPFSAIEGQLELKTCLILTAVDPLIGGLLAMGDRGTGKSTTVRAFAALLPPIKAVKDCPYHCDPALPQSACDQCRTATKLVAETIQVPVVDLPLGATEDRVAGALDLERALSRGDGRAERLPASTQHEPALSDFMYCISGLSILAGQSKSNL